MVLDFLRVLVFEKSHLLCQLIFKVTQPQKIPENDIFQKLFFFRWRKVWLLDQTLFQLQQGSICEDILLLLTKSRSFLEFQGIFEQIKTKRKIFRQSWTNVF